MKRSMFCMLLVVTAGCSQSDRPVSSESSPQPSQSQTASQSGEGAHSGGEKHFAITVTDDSFDEKILRESKPCLVDFWASWCGPCLMMGPTVEEIASEFQGRAVVAKVDVDASPKTAGKFDINAIPALYVFKNGEPVAKFVGVTSKGELVQAIEKALTEGAD